MDEAITDNTPQMPNPDWMRHSAVDQGVLDHRVQIAGWILAAVSIVCIYWPIANPLVPLAIGLAPVVLIGLVYFGNGRFLLLGPDKKTVVLGVLIPPLGLMVGTLGLYPLIDWQVPLAIGCGLGVALGLFAWAAHRRSIASQVGAGPRQLPTLLILTCVFVALGWSMCVQANALAWTLSPDTTSATISAKRVSGGKSRTHYLQFNEDLPFDVTEYQVRPDIYATHPVGDRVCVFIRKGLFGWRWYVVGELTDCPSPQTA